MLCSRTLVFANALLRLPFAVAQEIDNVIEQHAYFSIPVTVWRFENRAGPATKSLAFYCIDDLKFDAHRNYYEPPSSILICSGGSSGSTARL